ncbi:hypothetical protein ACLF3G_27095 [Falsiroseomonas sp. HC035]|uniref:hypothetical protein n=1 Tax=Falsiroseomonas sp. HC035 TaxID=3390999 RepID=UPI003D3221E4
MGAHWVATDAPELNGQPFDKTLLVGSYDGELTFVEPMITRAFLQTLTEAVLPVRAPRAAVGTLAWPAAYRVSFKDGVHHIALIGLILNPVDQNPWAQSRRPMDMMRQG